MQNNTNKKRKYPKGKILGITLVCVSLFMLLFTSVNWLYFIKSFFLGTFGVMCYPIFAFMLLFGAAFWSGRKFVMSKRYLAYLIVAFLCIIAIFHIIFTAKLDNSNFGNFLKDCYNAKFTPGGLIIGLFTYPVTGLLNGVAGGVLYGIILSVIIALIIDYLYAYKQYSKLIELQTPVQQPEEIVPDTSAQNTPTIFQNIIDEQAAEIEQDEYFEQESQEQTTKEVELSPREIARHRLNLNTQKSSDQESGQPLYDNAKGKLYDDKSAPEFMGRGVQNKPPKISSDGKKEDGNAILRDFMNRTYGIESSPNDANIINNSNFTNAFTTKNTPPKIEPTIQKEEPKSISPIISNTEFSPKQEFIKQSKTESKQEAFTTLFESKIEEPKTISPIKIEPIQPPKNEIFVSLDDEEPKSKGLSPLNPKVYDVASEQIQNTQETENDNDLEDNLIINQEPAPIKTDFVELDPAAAIAQENNISDSLQKDISINVKAPEVNNGIDVKYYQEIMAGAEKPKNKNLSKPAKKYNKPSAYVRPPVDMLTIKSVDPAMHSSDQEEKAAALENALAQFKIDAKVVAIRRGAAVTRFELQIQLGTPVSRIVQHANDIAMVLRANGEVRIEAPIRGKNAVGVEVPNDTVDTVGLKDIIESQNFVNSTSALTFALGKDVDGKIFTCNLQKMPHLLVAGTTGSGKSVCLNALIVSLLYKSSPEDVKFILIDPKRVEFSSFNYLPHMLVPTAITEAKKALNAFDWLINEMERRYSLLQDEYVKNIDEYNDLDKVHNGEVPKLPYIVLIVDEYADLQSSVPKKTDLEDRIKRLAAKARAAGIHMIIATQRPSVDVITGVIKNNLPSKIAFAVGSFQDSRTILSQGGAEKLLGKGDMLYTFNNMEPTRVQGAFITTDEVNNICEFIRENNAPDFDEEISEIIESENDNQASSYDSDGSQAGGGWDPIMKDAVRYFIETQRASASALQRKFALGFNKAARITEHMYEAKFIGPNEGGSKPRAVYITREQFKEIFGEEV